MNKYNVVHIMNIVFGTLNMLGFKGSIIIFLYVVRNVKELISLGSLICILSYIYLIHKIIPVQHLTCDSDICSPTSRHTLTLIAGVGHSEIKS